MSVEAVEKTGKLFTWKTFAQDHTRFAAMLPAYLGAYVSPPGLGRSLSPVEIESVMVTMNTYKNACPYCSGLHGQLARMAGANDIDALDPAVVYTKVFAQEAGRGPVEAAAFDALKAAMGPARASSVRSLCWALLWGKTTGNSINAARDKLLSRHFSDITTLDVVLLGYYGPLFFVIGVLNQILLKAPANVPSWFSSTLGAILWVPQALFIAPMGILCVAVNGGKVV